MRSRTSRVLPTIAALTIAPLWGCGGGSNPAVTPVEGKVSYKGQPVTTGTISFVPENGNLASGKIRPDGTYRLSTFGEGDGAVPGKYKVGIVATEGTVYGMPGSTPDYKPPKDLVPKEFNDPSKSDLTATVTKDNKVVNFDLK